MNKINRIFRGAILAASVVFFAGCATSPADHTNNLTELMLAANEHYKSGFLSDAEVSYRAIVERYPRYYEAWFKLGNVYVRTGQLEAAIPAYTQCIDINPQDQRAWYNLSLVRIKQAVNILAEGEEQLERENGHSYPLAILRRDLVKSIAGK